MPDPVAIDDPLHPVPGPVIFTNADVEAQLDARAAVSACRDAIRADWAGLLGAPPRQSLHLGLAERGELTVTAGGVADHFGFRVYGGVPGGDELVSVWRGDGRLELLTIGSRLGQYRTGAIGAAAADTLARPGSVAVGLVGAGAQAWAQIWALSGVRTISRLHVSGRTSDRAERLAARARDELGLDATATSAEQAVTGADIVLLATGAGEPVIESDWVRADAHVTTIARNTPQAYEIPLSLLATADVVVTDSPQQIDAYPQGYVTGAVHRQPDHLGAVLSGDRPGRGPETGRTVFCSVGLAGTEVLVARTLLG